MRLTFGEIRKNPGRYKTLTKEDFTYSSERIRVGVNPGLAAHWLKQWYEARNFRTFEVSLNPTGHGVNIDDAAAPTHAQIHWYNMNIFLIVQANPVQLELF